ncbi:MAG TPA: hypothetical protein H9831_13540 [Candidatus Eisenbergiella pullistercoris]|uniref:ABC transporter permease n=1 Tax=Candidatus Eisenbergiella pullistercoris TaxID=2838555 RepID=A0A9D2C8M3_9FIRM|nr:hypothetical protein [Candidatus Eisenbergiella pullistercoris]
MYHYTAVQWLFFFFFYCFFGWCFESAYVSLCKRKFVNRGFVRGPFLPLYGSGAILMLLVSAPVKENLLFVFLSGCVGATALEYVTGVAMEALFKVRYWDYSNQRFNFQGQICLSSTLCWGALTVFMSRCLHPAVERLAFLIPPALMAGLVTVILVWFSVDFAFSFQAAMDLRDILVRAERAKKELERMQKRLDVLIAVAGEELDSRKEAFEEKRDAFADWREEMARQREDRRENRREELRLGMEELLDGLEERFSRIRKELPASERLKEKREELMELRDRYVGSRRVREEKLEAFFRGANRRRLLGSNPSMRSKRFQDVLDDLKKAASEYRNRRDRD